MGIFFVFFSVLLVAFWKINELKNIKYYQPELLRDKKILTVYYSNIGNTKSVAQTIHSVVGGDIQEMELVKKFPNNIFTMSKLVRKQKKEGFLPQINDIEISDYDVIFVGSPIWIFSVSLPVHAFLKNKNFENKILIPFFTYSGGANKKKIINELKDKANAKDVRKPLFMFENGLFLQKEQIIKWLNNI